ncbi:Protein phosphatase 2C 3 [Linum grandiflorum]
MAGMCCGVVGGGETEVAATVEPTSKVSRRRRLELRQFSLSLDVAAPSFSSSDGISRKQRKLVHSAAPSSSTSSSSRDCLINAVENSIDLKRSESVPVIPAIPANSVVNDLKLEHGSLGDPEAKFGLTSVCGRRRDMEDAVSVQTSFGPREGTSFFGLFDGHGCSHVAMKCKDRLHEIVEEEIRSYEKENPIEWKETMERSFAKMDGEVGVWSEESAKASTCRCELQTPQCDAVGSTAVAAVVTPDKIVVSNCGDSRAVLCRNGVAVPLSSDHKPDRPDELLRIEAAGGRVIYWDGARVLGVLAMSRAIGDNYLKPYVIPEPEVTITERTGDEECLILASDGLWDVVSNETACGVVKMCLAAQKSSSPMSSEGVDAAVGSGSDKACFDASMLLTKLALARHSSDNVSVIVVDLRRKSSSSTDSTTKS